MPATTRASRLATGARPHPQSNPWWMGASFYLAQPYNNNMTTTTDTQLVYRIENVHGRGAYQGIIGVHRWADNHVRHPAPNLDGLPRVNYSDRFGFDSLNSLRSWFTLHELHCLVAHNNSCLSGEHINQWETAETMAERVMFLAVIRVKTAAIQYGHRQLMFDNAHADRIMFLPLDPKLIAQL